ncbi:hypothetical protein OC835_000845 [Tilletia horrida]|nr:hypothetical protein OC835_000845 [Tilletia horrida]
MSSTSSSTSKAHAKKSSTSSIEEDDAPASPELDELMDIDPALGDGGPGAGSSGSGSGSSGNSNFAPYPRAGFQHPDIIGRLPVYLSLSLANIRAANATAGNGGASPFPFAKPQPSSTAGGNASEASTPQPGPTLHAFQYPILPARQPLPVPESARARNIRPAMRWKGRNNIVQIELPIDPHPAAYNEHRGEEHERGAERARKLTGAPGMMSAAAASSSSSSSAGSSRLGVKSEGRGTTPGSSSSRSSSKSGRNEGADGHGNGSSSGKLDRSRLESFEVPQQHSDIFVGVIRDGAVHLSPLDSTGQLRPTMHYLDALDDIEKQEKKRARALAAAAAAAASASDMELSGLSSGDELGAGPPGGGGPGRGGGNAGGSSAAANAKKAVNVTVSLRGEAGDSRRGGPGGGPGGGRFGNSLGAGADARDALMGAVWDAEAERWTDLDWQDEETDEAATFFEKHLFARNKQPLLCKLRQADYVCN